MKRYIYEVKNNITGETYIGKHTPKLGVKDTYMGSGVRLKEAQKEYGIENFSKTILIEGDFSEEEIAELEISYIKEYKERGKAEYNISSVSLGGDTSKYIDYDVVSNSLHNLYQNNPQKLQELRERAKIYSVPPPPMYGEDNGMYGKHHTEEVRKQLSENSKGSKNNQYGKHWYTNGTDNIMAYECPEGYHKGKIPNQKDLEPYYTDGVHNKRASSCPEGWWKGFSLTEEERAKRGYIKGKHHYNNGEIEVLAFECPEGFVKGVLKKK